MNAIKHQGISAIVSAEENEDADVDDDLCHDHTMEYPSAINKVCSSTNGSMLS